MQYVVKFALFLIFAAGFGLLFSPLLTVTLNDAFLDFLDDETANTVTDYFRRTELSRAVGIGALLLFWTCIVIAIDRAIDHIMR
jgi:uncharacterized BrkB/YihY/UPF0761 family membrane protein